MIGVLELDSNNIEADITHWMDVIVLSNGQILFNIKRGPDLTDRLEKMLQEMGLKCHQQFKSPCG